MGRCLAALVFAALLAAAGCSPRAAEGAGAVCVHYHKSGSKFASMAISWAAAGWVRGSHIEANLQPKEGEVSDLSPEEARSVEELVDTADVLAGAEKARRRWEALLRMTPLLHVANAPLVRGDGRPGWGGGLPGGTRALHVVRRPDAMLISNYLYHRRMPVSEPWIGEPFEGDQCAHEEHDGAVWRASGLPPLAPARSLCEELLGEARRRSGNARLSINRALNALDEADGLKFEAARLYAGQTWWVTIMTGNACAARDDPRVLQTSMAELRGNEGAMFGALRHLGFGAPDRFPGFNLTATTARAMKSVLWSSAPEEFRKQHYTARDVTPERRAELVSLLLGDAVLGPLVNHTQAVLDRPREACPDLSRARRGRTVLF